MPSAAQIHGATVLDDILAAVAGGELDPRNITKNGPEERPSGVLMRARAAADGSPGVGITVPAHPNRGFAGEYNQTITVPTDRAHPYFDHAVSRLSQLLGRWIEVQRVSLEHARAVDAAGGDIDRRAPVPASTINCPLVLRVALDVAGVPFGERAGLAEREACLEADGVEIRIDDVDRDEPERWSRSRPPQRSVRRATIKGPGFRWSQGVNLHYLDVDQTLPATVVNAVVGMPAASVVDMPWLHAPGVEILRATRRKGGTRFLLSRAHAHLAGPRPLVGHVGMSDGIGD